MKIELFIGMQEDQGQFIDCIWHSEEVEKAGVSPTVCLIVFRRVGGCPDRPGWGGECLSAEEAAASEGPGPVCVAGAVQGQSQWASHMYSAPLLAAWALLAALSSLSHVLMCNLCICGQFSFPSESLSLSVSLFGLFSGGFAVTLGNVFLLTLTLSYLL